MQQYRRYSSDTYRHLTKFVSQSIPLFFNFPTPTFGSIRPGPAFEWSIQSLYAVFGRIRLKSLETVLVVSFTRG